MRTMSSVEFNIVRLQGIEQSQQDNLTYCDILNSAKTMDVYYHRYDRAYVQDQIYTHGGVMSFNRLDRYIGRHFNYIDIDTDFEDIPALIQSIKQQAIPELPILIYLNSWKLFLIPIEVLKALKTAGIYLLLDECYESYVDHLYSYFTWSTMCGLEDLNNIRIISGRYNGQRGERQHDHRQRQHWRVHHHRGRRRQPDRRHRQRHLHLRCCCTDGCRHGSRWCWYRHDSGQRGRRGKHKRCYFC